MALTCLPTAVILAGGLGTRLRSVVSDRPKALAQIESRPFLAYLLDDLEAQGIRRVVLATGFMGDLVEEVLGTAHGQIQLLYSRESQPLGTAGAIAQALPLLGPNPFLVFNGDSFCPIDLAAFIHQAMQLQTAATLACCRVDDATRFGLIRFNQEGRVRAFSEKQPGTSGWINAGIYFVHPDLFSQVPRDRAVSLEREIFPQLLPDRLGVFCLGSELLDIGTPESYQGADAFLLDRQPALTFLEAGAWPGIRLRPGVGVLVFDHKGRVLLEKRADCGMWGLLGGRIEPGESLLTAAHREVREETGLEIAVRGLFGVYSSPEERTIGYDNNGDIRHIIDIVLLADLLLGTVSLSHESELLEFFSVKNLPCIDDVLPAARKVLQDLSTWTPGSVYIN